MNPAESSVMTFSHNLKKQIFLLVIWFLCTSSGVAVDAVGDVTVNLMMIQTSNSSEGINSHSCDVRHY